MSTFLNPQGINAFIRLVNNRKNGVFVDKTNFIGETIKRLDTELNLIAFTRPRRFGKTVMAKMLATYYSKGANYEKLFAKLDIANFSYIKEINFKKPYPRQYHILYLLQKDTQ